MRNKELIEHLPTVITKQDLIDSLEASGQRMDVIVLPSYMKVSGLIDPKNPTSKYTADLDAIYKRSTGRNDSVVDFSLISFNKLFNAIETFKKDIESNVSDNFTKDAISVKELNYIKIIKVIDFMINYSIKLLDFYLASDNAEFEGNSFNLTESFSKSDIKFIEDHFNQYLNALLIFDVESRQITHLISKTLDIVVTEDNVDAILKLHDNHKVDPLKVNRFFDFNVKNNLLYRIQSWWASNQATSYKVMQEKKRLLEYRLLLLQRNRQGDSDPVLEKEIEILENRISKLTYRLEQDGKVYGL